MRGPEPVLKSGYEEHHINPSRRLGPIKTLTIYFRRNKCEDHLLRTTPDQTRLIDDRAPVPLVIWSNLQELELVTHSETLSSI